MEPKDKEIIIIDEDGVEVKMEILFTYENEERKAQYVLYFDPANPSDILAARYDDENRLHNIESDEEWDEIEEVLNTFQDDPTFADKE